MDTLLNLKTFAAVASGGGFSDAARRLHVVPSVVAKRIDQLENTIGARLFERSTRHVRLTEAGEQLQAKAIGVLAGFDDLVRSVQRDESKLEGHIRLMAPTTLTMLRLGPLLNAFLAQHERISLEISLVDLSTNPEEQGCDLAISGRSVSYQGVFDVPLCSARPLLVAAPAYVRRHGLPTHPRDLVQHSCLVFAATGKLWHFQSKRGTLSVEVKPRLVADDNLTVLGAVTMGLGIGPLPHYVAKDAIAKSDLQLVLSDFPLQENWFRAYVPRRRYQVARVRALVDWLVAHAVEDDFANVPA